MWVDEPNWNVQSSFLSPVTPPGVEPDSAPLVCVSFSQAWLPYVLGALMQLVQPAAWRGDAATVLTVLDQATGLVESVGAAEVCVMPAEWRFTTDCLLQYSYDGGTTWTTVTGYPINAAACYTGATGATGPTGPAGAFDPGVPPIQSGQTTADLACSVAGYIAQQFIQASLGSVVASINAGETILQAATVVGALVPELNVVLAPVLGAAAVLYNIVNAGTLSHFNSASTDPVLLSDLTCAIYGATSADGYVTPSNFAAVVSAIGAISYVHTDVITAIVSYLNAGAAIVLQAVQLPGALAVVDCSGCGGPAPATALFFEGSGTSRMSVANISNGTGVSFMTWYNSSTGGQNATLYYGNKTSGSNAGIQFYLSGGTLNLFVQASGGGAVNITANIGLSSGNHHVGFAVNNTNMVIYIDGVAHAVGVPPAGPWGAGTQGTFVMCDNTLAANVVAVVWRMATYATALASTVFAAAYAAGTFAVPPGSPTHYWPFEDGSGTAIADVVGGNTGTVHAPFAWTTHS